MTREAGFTLIEALVALALGAMVVAAVLSAVRIAAAGSVRAQAAASDAEGFSRAGTILAGDAAHALWIDGPQGQPLFEGSSDGVDLPQTGRPLSGEQWPRPPVLVRYRIRPEGAGARLTRSEASLSGAGPAATGAEVTLWQTSGRIEFRFLDAKGAWQRNWSAQDRLPRAFAVTDPANDVPRLVAALPDLLPARCANGPDPACPLPYGAFP